MNFDLSKMCGVNRRVGGPRLFADFPVRAIISSEWYDFTLPTYSQQFPSCVGHATANWIELMIRRYLGKTAIPRGHQIDGDAIWKRGREMFYGGSLDGGLLMDHGLFAAIDLGILPKESKPGRLASNLGVVSHALEATPILQGTSVHAGWNQPDPENGEIAMMMPDPFAGHATLIVATTRQDDQMGVVFQNSWGASWGRYGYGILREDQWKNYLLDDPVTCSLPESWTTWTGWRRYLIATPKEAQS